MSKRRNDVPIHGKVREELLDIRCPKFARTPPLALAFAKT
jgi:hypothetical protein